MVLDLDAIEEMGEVGKRIEFQVREFEREESDCEKE